MIPEDAQQTFISHLIELRDRLLRIFVGIIVVFVALFHWSGDIYHLLALPMLNSLPKGGQMVATEVTTPFFVPMKVTMMAAFLISLPHTLYQAWSFIAPGLYDHEKKMIAPLVVASTILFVVGMAFAYFLVFPVVFGFMNQVAPSGVAVMTDIGHYLDFVLGMFLAFGVTFEVPIAVILLVRFGVVSVAKLKEARSYVIVGSFVVAAVVTPPDVLSQVMLAVPLWLLYEAGVIVAGWLDNKTDDVAA
ncbi:MAG: twin-arginine translocase subunit TatC [Chitinivorax sp.]